MDSFCLKFSKYIKAERVWKDFLLSGSTECMMKISKNDLIQYIKTSQLFVRICTHLLHSSLSSEAK